jgi:aminopeptidase N
MRGRLLATGGLFLSLALVSTASAQQFTPGARSAGDRLLPLIGNGGYDVQHYDLTINYEPVANTMVSSTDITLRATQNLSEFSLDLHRNLNVTGVTIDGVAATVSRPEGTDKLVVTPAAGIVNNRVFHAVVAYSGTPVQVIDPDGSSEGWARITSGGFVVNQPMGAHGWFPNNNYPTDKALYDFHITAPSTHTALGNGELVSKVDNGNGTSTWNWKHTYPMSTYLTTATVGLFDYRRWTSPAPPDGPGALGRSGAPLELYDAHESALSATQKANAITAANRQDDIVKFMADAIGRPYPYESHGTVLHRNNLGYALEVQTKSHFSGTSISLSTLAHEITHQWFGDSVTSETWSDLWFNEGWATWWAWYWNNKQNGNATTVEQQFTNNYNSTTQPTRWNTPPALLPDATVLFSTFPTYTRPAMMLEAYRQIVGEPAFFDFQRALLDQRGYNTINRLQFIAIAKQVAAERAGFEASNLKKLDIFFDQWLLLAGKPTMTPTTFFQSTTESTDASGTVPATLSLTLGGPVTFGAFTPGVARDYTASTMANVISTAGDATLSVADPSSTATGHLVNGAFSLPQPLQASASSAGGTAAPGGAVGGSAAPTTLLTYTGPVSNDAVTMTFKQSIAANDALRTGTYSKTLTFTLSTTNP